MAAKSVASKSTAHALDKAGDVTDVASAKAAAKSVGDVAKKEGLNQLTNLAGKYFGGAGTPYLYGTVIILIFCIEMTGRHLSAGAGARSHICTVLRTWCHISYYILA